MSIQQYVHSCKEAVQIVVQMLDKTLPEIENIFVLPCKEMLKFLPYGEMECKAIASRDIPAIKHFLESGHAPETVCQKLKAC
ncbi:surfactant protein B [Ostertagia ostertagi]